MFHCLAIRLGFKDDSHHLKNLALENDSRLPIQYLSNITCSRTRCVLPAIQATRAALDQIAASGDASQPLVGGLWGLHHPEA